MEILKNTLDVVRFFSRGNCNNIARILYFPREGILYPPRGSLFGNKKGLSLQRAPKYNHEH